MKTGIYLLMLLLLSSLTTGCIVSGELGSAGSGDSTSASANDTTPPTAANSLGWDEPAIHDSDTINANWTISTSLDLKSQTLSLYANGTCTAPVILSDSTIDHTTSSKQFTSADGIADGNTYSYTIRSFDESGNSTTSACSSSIALAFTYVASATGLSWTQTSPSNSTTATAEWVPSTAADLDSQRIQLYTDAACTTPDGASQLLPATTTSYNFTLVDGSTRYFGILSKDNDGNDSSGDPCSPIISIDTTAPTTATSISWSEGSTHNNTSANASWTVSVSGDVDYQQIELHDDGTCTSAVAGYGFSDNNGGSLGASVTTFPFTSLSNATTYSYNIKVVDTAGNSTTTCSSSIAIDTSEPEAPTSLGWDQTTPHDDSADASATWTLSASGDVTQQQIRYYSDAACTTSIDIGDGAGVWTSIGIGVNSHTYLTVGTGTTGVTYYYQTRVTDAASNIATSACSTELEIDTTPPNEPVTHLASSLDGTIANGGLLKTVWTKSTSNDIAYQIVNYWSDAACATTLVSTAIVGSSVENHSGNPATFSPVGASDNYYYFTVMAVDSADNQSTTTCTGPLQYDVAVPTGATVVTTNAGGLAWTDNVPAGITNDYFDGLTIRAIWTPSVDGDTDYEVINYYTDSACATTPVVTYGSSATSATSGDANLEATLSQLDDGTTYYFSITTYDDVGNSTVSTNCSAPMEIRLSQLKAIEDNAESGDQLGTSVAIYGTIAVLGSPLDDSGAGSISIYEKSGGAWAEMATIFGSQIGECGATAGAHFGAAVAIDINTIIVGMPDSGTGYACIYKKVSGVWTYQTRLSPFGVGVLSGDQFGSSVAISGATAIVGAPSFNSNEGAAYVFEDTGTWGSVVALAPTCTGAATSYFGTDVAIDGIVALVGAPECGSSSEGSVFFYEYDGLDWNEEQVENGAASDTLGTSVDIDGTRAVLGAPGNDTAYVYTQIVSWTLEETLGPVGSDGAGFGTSVAISGNAVAVGAPLDDTVNTDNGALFIYEYDGAWQANEEYYYASDQDDGDEFATSVDIYSETALVGSPKDETSTGAGYFQLIN